MAVLDRSELEASPLADLHAIADQVGLEGFRRMRKAALVNAILGEEPPEPSEPESGGEGEEEESPVPRRRRSRRSPAAATAEAEDRDEDASERPARRSRGRGARSSSSSASSGERTPRSTESAEDSDGARAADGEVEVLGNGSAFLRVDPPEPSDSDVYISAAQVRRCELVSGDRVSGPVRTPRRSERYPSLIRIDTINGVAADAVSDGSRYEDLPVAWPSERLALDAEDPTLKAIEWLAPIGLGSRAVIVGASQSGKTEILRRILDCLHTLEDLEISLVLAGARPEEIAQWGEGAVQPAAALSFAASSEAQGQAIERALDAAKRVASRGGNALVLIDSLEQLGPHVARKALAAARNLHDGGSLTLIATAPEPLGGETTVIALDRALTLSGREPIIDLMASGTLRPELLVGEDGAKAIAKARATALEDHS
jgi:transcription termination factor Rho